MSAADEIRKAVADVGTRLTAARLHPPLGEATVTVKGVQAQRFRHTYADLLGLGPYGAVAGFFLDELYSDRDFSERDAQFARIAGTIEKVFPQPVAQVAVALAQLHALTEELDQAMGSKWLEFDGVPPGERYVLVWRGVGRRPDRDRQLKVVLDVGEQLARLTRKPGLRTMLRMMRGPASAVGFDALQRFLETGFDTFGALAKDARLLRKFLGTIEARERLLITTLFEAPLETCTSQMDAALGQAR